MKNWFAMLVAVLGVLLPLSARADDDTMQCDSHGRNCEISFTDVVVAGTVYNPNDTGVRSTQRPLPVNLIRIRTNFVPEMLRSVENL